MVETSDVGRSPVRTADPQRGVNGGDTVAIGLNGGARLGNRRHDIRVSEA